MGDSTQQGAANRTLVLNAEPFGDVRAAQAMCHLVAEQHGTAGRAFVEVLEVLRRNPREFYVSEFSRIRDAVGAMAGGHPQADNIALIVFADTLSGYYVFSPGGDWQACMEGALELARWALGSSTGSGGGDTDLKAIQFVAEWLVRNRIHFDDSCEMDRLERWGACEDYRNRPGFMWCVFSSVLDKALADANFDCQKTLRRMADEGVLVMTGSGRGSPARSGSRAGAASTAPASTTEGSRRSWSPPRTTRPPWRLARWRHVETEGKTALSAGERRCSRLCSLRLYRFEGWRVFAPARLRARAHAGAGMPRPNSAETLRRRAFALLAGLAAVLTALLREVAP